MTMPQEVTPFVEAGFALHWLHDRDKKPIGDNWSNKPVASLDSLRRRYVDGNNVGVRLGEFSEVAGGFLHVLDIDIRDAKFAGAAWDAIDRLFPNVPISTFPSVVSGSGGESRHVYFIANEPFRSKKLAKSDGFQMVFDQSKGRDVRQHDFEIELFGTLKQVVMPPSIHPKTGQPYRWERPFDFDLLDMGITPTVSVEALSRAGASVDEDDGEPVNNNRLGLDRDEAREILALLPLGYWCEDRDGWRSVGMALKHEFGDDGYDLWLEFSKQSPKFDEKDQRTVWKSFKGKTKRPIRMATLKAETSSIRIAAELDDLVDDLDGLDDLTSETVAPISNSMEDAIASLMRETPADALPWRSLLDVDPEKGAIRATLHNVELIVKNDDRLVGLPQLNEFTQETVQRTPPGTKRKSRANAAKDTRQLSGRVWEVRDTLNGEIWSSSRDYSIRSILEAPKTQGGYGMKISDRDLKAATVLAAWQNSFHPVREYLSGLVWDRTPRMERLFIDYLGCADSPYTRNVARLMMLAAVSRVFEPGSKWDYAIILEGLQGAGKSTFIRTLGRRWFSELEGDFHDGKEMVEKIQGSWIVEIPELSGFSRSDVQSIKAFISRQTDKVRLAYEARAMEFPRQCILIGSTNDKEYLRDPTGGRRFFPVECHVESIDNAALRQNIDQLWAEARAVYVQMRKECPVEMGDLPLYLENADAAEEAARLQESRRVESADDALAGQIAAWLQAPVMSESLEDDQPFRTETCLLELWVECMGNDRKNYSNAAAPMLGRAMRLVPGWSLSSSKKRFAKYGQQRFYTKGNDAERSGRMGILKFN
jgi:hypothetical protein